MARRPTRGGLPSRQQILDFIQASDEPAGKREIARAFRLDAHGKLALKQLLRDMADEGLIDSAPGRAFHKMGGVPKVTVLRVVDVDDSGRAFAVPERWEAEGAAPRLRVMERKGRGSALGVGDRMLGRAEEGMDGWIAHPMKKLLKGSELVLGVVHEEGAGHWLRPVEKKERRELPISDLGGAEAGDPGLGAEGGRPARAAAGAAGAGPHHPRRSVRAEELQPDRDPQARHPASVFGGGAGGGGAGGRAGSGRARGPDPHPARRDRP